MSIIKCNAVKGGGGDKSLPPEEIASLINCWLGWAGLGWAGLKIGQLTNEW